MMSICDMKKTASRGHILIVDDDTVVRHPLRLCLSREGYWIEEAGCGEEGLAKFKESSFDLILVDLVMPGMSGIEMISKIREDDPLIPCVILTGHPDVCSTSAALDANVFKYLVKPFKLTALKQVVAECMERGRKARSEAQAARLLEERTQQLHQAEARYKTLVEQVPAVIYTATLDEANAVLYVSPQIEQLLGFSPAQWIADPQLWFRQIHPEDRERVRAERISNRADLAVRPFRSEYRILTNDGREVWLYDEAVPVRDETGRTAFIQGFMLDISARKEAEREASRINKALRTLGECNLAVVRAKDEPALLDKVCRILVEVGEYNLAWVGVVSEDLDSGGFPITWATRSKADEEYVRSLLYEEPGAMRSGCPIAARALTTGTLQLIRSIPGSSDSDFAPQSASSVGYRASISLPLINEKNILGALNIHSSKSDAFDSQEVTLLRKLASDVAFGMSVLKTRAERRKAAEERTRLVTAIEQTAEGIVITDTEGIVIYANPSFERITGYDCRDILGDYAPFLPGKGQAGFFCAEVMAQINSGESWRGRICDLKKGESLYEIELSISPVHDLTGTVSNYVAVMRDVTSEARLEQQLRRAQKLESIGTLTGGIAHDFNNIIMAIMGYAELAIKVAAPESDLKHKLDQVLKGSCRARDLVQQILSFCRQNEQQNQPIALKPIIKESLKLLRSTLPTTIDIRQQLSQTDEDVVLADCIRIHQVLMNLCTNAAHAMRKDGGVLTVELSSLRLDAESAKTCGLLWGLESEGDYLKLTVRDSGHGIDPEISEKIFDPFFTTKEVGEGTGLGLPIVQGIVKNLGGLMSFESEPEKGTAFHVFLPRFFSEQTQDVELQPVAPEGKERILFVDDEAMLVDMAKEMLEELGYSVEAFTDSLDALDAFSAQPENFDLVITDQTMPHMTGLQLAEELNRMRPDMPIILYSGYCSAIKEEMTPEATAGIGIREIVAKPVNIRDLAVIIRRVFEGRLEKGEKIEENRDVSNT